MTSQRHRGWFRATSNKAVNTNADEVTSFCFDPFTVWQIPYQGWPILPAQCELCYPAAHWMSLLLRCVLLPAVSPWLAVFPNHLCKVPIAPRHSGLLAFVAFAFGKDAVSLSESKDHKPSQDPKHSGTSLEDRRLSCKVRGVSGDSLQPQENLKSHNSSHWYRAPGIPPELLPSNTVSFILLTQDSFKSRFSFTSD